MHGKAVKCVTAQGDGCRGS